MTYAYRSARQVEHVEGDEEGKRVTLTEWEQDRFGKVTKKWQWGEVVGDDRLAGHDEAITVRTFAGDEQEWVLGYLASEEVMSAAGERVSLRRQYYDGEAFEGLPLGQVVRGDVSRVEECEQRRPRTMTTETRQKHETPAAAEGYSRGTPTTPARWNPSR